MSAPQVQRAERDRVRPKLGPIVRIKAHPLFPRYWMVYERHGIEWKWIYPPYRTQQEALAAAHRLVERRRLEAAQSLADAVWIDEN